MALPRPELELDPEPVRLLDGARETWRAMLDAIAGARRTVELELYAFSDRGIGDEFLRALALAAARGVRVRVAIDAWGSLGSATRVIERLRASGCEARVHNRLRLGLIGHFNRNHRKLLLVDGEVAVLGGINVADQFADWADVAVEVRGAPCRALARRLSGERYVPQEGAVRVHLSRIGGGRRLRRIYLKAFAGARRRIVVAHSYFLPDAKLMRSLGRAAARGVDVQILLPGRSDVPLAHLAAASYYRKLLRRGVRILEWEEGILHAKLAVIDSRQLLVGSFNLDSFSLSNLEALLVAEDARAAGRAEAWVARLSASARPAEPPRRWAWLGWIVQRLLRLAGRLMRL